MSLTLLPQLKLVVRTTRSPPVQRDADGHGVQDDAKGGAAPRRGHKFKRLVSVACIATPPDGVASTTPAGRVVRGGGDGLDRAGDFQEETWIREKCWGQAVNVPAVSAERC